MVETQTSQIAEILKLFDLSVTDGTMILVVIPIFAVLWALLEKFFFAPYLMLAETRESLTIGSQEKAARNQEQVKLLTEQYESGLLAERVRAVEAKLKVIAEAKAQAVKIIDQAESEAQDALKKVRAEIASNLAQNESETIRQAESLSNLIRDRIQSSSRGGAVNIQ